MASKTHTLELTDNPGQRSTPEPMPLRVKICDNESGTEYTIQAVKGGLRISVEQAIVIRPQGSNAIEIRQASF